MCNTLTAGWGRAGPQILPKEDRDNGVWLQEYPPPPHSHSRRVREINKITGTPSLGRHVQPPATETPHRAPSFALHPVPATRRSSAASGSPLSACPALWHALHPTPLPLCGTRKLQTGNPTPHFSPSRAAAHRAAANLHLTQRWWSHEPGCSLLRACC